MKSWPDRQPWDREFWIFEISSRWKDRALRRGNYKKKHRQLCAWKIDSVFTSNKVNKNVPTELCYAFLLYVFGRGYKWPSSPRFVTPRSKRKKDIGQSTTKVRPAVEVKESLTAFRGKSQTKRITRKLVILLVCLSFVFVLVSFSPGRLEFRHFFYFEDVLRYLSRKVFYSAEVFNFLSSHLRFVLHYAGVVNRLQLPAVRCCKSFTTEPAVSAVSASRTGLHPSTQSSSRARR